MSIIVCLCQSCVWHGSFTYVTWCIHVRAMTFWCFSYVCDMPHPSVCHDSFIRDTRQDLKHTRSTNLRSWMTHLNASVWHGSFICDTQAQDARYSCPGPKPKRHDICDMTHSYLWHVSFINLFIQALAGLVHTCDMTRSYACHTSCISVPSLIQHQPRTRDKTNTSASRITHMGLLFWADDGWVMTHAWMRRNRKKTRIRTSHATHIELLFVADVGWVMAHVCMR